MKHSGRTRPWRRVCRQLLCLLPLTLPALDWDAVLVNKPLAWSLWVQV